jgi:hypothetical protein
MKATRKLVAAALVGASVMLLSAAAASAYSPVVSVYPQKFTLTTKKSVAITVAVGSGRQKLSRVCFDFEFGRKALLPGDEVRVEVGETWQTTVTFMNPPKSGATEYSRELCLEEQSQPELVKLFDDGYQVIHLQMGRGKVKVKQLSASAEALHGGGAGPLVEAEAVEPVTE